MIIDANQQNCRGWRVWHCELLRQLKTVVWVDDESNRYAQYLEPIRIVDGEIPIEIKQAKKILIRLDIKTVFINPVEDAAPAESLITHKSVTTPAIQAVPKEVENV